LIFAHVTVNGKTLSNSYPLKVLPNLNPKAISVNGKNIKGFKPEVKAYSYLLKSMKNVPMVSAEAAGNDISADITQANAIPGTAVVTLTDNITLENNVYYINFDVKSVSDEFNNTTPRKQWNWVRENSTNWSLSKKSGSLVITSKEGDIVESNNNAENILLQSANTDWSIESKIVCSRKPTGFSENAGILAYQDDDNFVKLVSRSSMGRRRFGFGRSSSPGEQPGAVELIVESYGNQKSSNTLNMDGIIKENNTLILKLEKRGAQYIASCSSDGEKFEMVGTADIALKDIKAGMIACKGALPERMSNFRRFMQQNEPDSPFEVAFDYFHIVNSGLELKQ